VTLENWIDEITNYLISRLTIRAGAAAQAVGSKASTTRSKFSNVVVMAFRVLKNLFRRIWLDLNGLDAFTR